jgi:hypothetical protein
MPFNTGFERAGSSALERKQCNAAMACSDEVFDDPNAETASG